MAEKSRKPAKIHPVVLSGGSGTRLWPMSREAYPKQLLPLTSEWSLLQETARRVADTARFEPLLVVCNDEHRFIVAEQLRQADIVPGDVVLEPVGRNTAPAVAVAALIAAKKDPDALILVLPSDHTIADNDAFAAAIDAAANAAAQGALVTFGIRPSSPETGYGYIHRGSPLMGVEGCFKVDAFVEKPNEQTAKTYLADGGYDWNSGMFLFPAKSVIDELGRMEPEMLAGCRTALDAAARDLDFLRLDKQAFAAVPSKSIDYAVMEHTRKACVVPADIGWSDVGSWSALWDIGDKDKCGNVLTGDVQAIDVKNSYLRAEGRLIAAVGVQDLVVVATEDVVLVMPKDRAQDVRAIVDALKSSNRPEPAFHPRVYRPWGFYQSVHEGDRFQVKRISVNPGAQLSLQMHHHRAEHWIIVYGTAKVTRGEDSFLLAENESAYIPPFTKHRLENPGKVPLDLIEVQTGSYLGEDDIVRYEDVYGRETPAS